MSLKLGEILVNEKMITSFQLEEALKYQVLYGGKIGINLIEMGYVKEEDIARMLSGKFGLPFIEPGKLKYIPGKVIAQIPAEIATRYSVVPIALNGTTLTLAMANPTDLEVIDEISFRTGLSIFPVVTPELSLTNALKKYYKISRDLRPVDEKMAADENQIQHGSTARKTHSVSDSDPPKAAYMTKKGTESHLKLVEKKSGNSVQSFNDDNLTMEKASIWLANIESCNDAASILIRFASQMFRRSALFMVKGEKALGWVSNVEGKEVENFNEFQIFLEKPSILKTIVETKKNFVGQVPFSPVNSKIISSFGGSFKESGALVPLPILEQVVAVLYVDGEISHPKEYLLFKLQVLVAKVVMALEILILKKKIIML